ncbi:hypothetical protein [Bacillus sp. FJAT-44742]|uniref:hypothetical protein n=1 Tax=Bacillus sp. FJAT-44742 TaxID=2014005 RepID=UPI000C23E517|nr:hypothetical protein [Bacillus sp. FJAT-44742]
MKLCRKHIVYGVITILISYLFFLTRSEWDPMHAWNRAFANVSLLYLFIIMFLGPFSKIKKGVGKWLPARRELGIWGGIAALIHIFIIFDGWIEWEFSRLFVVFSPVEGSFFLHPGFAIGNIIGIVATIYLIFLLLTSNNKSMRFLGQKTWKHVQQKAGIYYMLVVLHTTYFIFLHMPQNPNWIQGPFLISILVIILVQGLAFCKESKKSRSKMNTK